MNGVYTQNPTEAQVNAIAGKVLSGPANINYETTGGFWTSGVQAADVEKFLVFKYQSQGKNKLGRFFMHVFFEHFSMAKYPTFNNDYEWGEFGKTFQGTTIGNITTGNAATVVFESTRDAADAYVEVGDHLKGYNGNVYEVTNVGTSGGKEEITMTLDASTSITTGTDISNSDVLGFVTWIGGERSSAPVGRTFYPTYRMNKTSVVRETSDHSGHATSTKTTFQLPDGSSTFMYVQDSVALDHFMTKRENNLAYGQYYTATQMKTKGIVPDIMANATVKSELTTALIEEDFQDHMATLDTITDQNNFMGLFGKTYYDSAQRALKEYFRDGSVDYGAFSPAIAKQVGLHIDGYSFGGKSFAFTPYLGFSDTAVNPVPSAPSATYIDYRQMALFLNRGGDGGEAKDVHGNTIETVPYMSCKYKAIPGHINRSFVMGWYHGMTGLSQQQTAGLNQGVSAFPVSQGPHLTNPGGIAQVAHGGDFDRMYLLSEEGVRLVAPDVAHSFMRAIA